MHAWELVHKWKVKGVTIKTNNSIWLSAIILLMLNKQHRNETTYDLLMVHDAVCVDDEPHRLTLAALGNRDIGKININNDKASMSNGKLVKVVFEPLILIEDKVEVSFHIRSSVKFKPFPFGANSLSDGKLDVTAPPCAELSLANVLISLPSKYVLIWPKQKGLSKS